MIAVRPVIQHIADGPAPDGSRLVAYAPDGRTEIGLAALDQQAQRVAAHLVALGVESGDRIGIAARNGIAWILLDLAAIKIKAVTAGFDIGKVAVDADLIRAFNLRLVFTDRVIDHPRVLPIASIDAAAKGTGELPALPPVAYRDDDVTTIKFTSGSTGRPKGLAARVGSIDLSISAVQSLLHHGGDDRLFVFLPLSLLQQRYWIYSALVHGHDVVVSTYELAPMALTAEEPTVVMGVPGFYDALAKIISAQARTKEPEALRAQARRILGPHIRYLWTGSAPAAPKTLAFFEHTCCMPIFEGYGMNETCIVTKNVPGAHRPGSVGRPLPGKRISLDEDGVVIVHSDQPVNTEYLFSAPGDSERMFRPDGSVRTGDLGRLDGDGYLYILGRTDDVVVLGNGNNVMVRPIEERLRICREIEDCVVFGAGSNRLGAIVSAARHARAAIERHVATVNQDSKPDERIAEIVIADEPFSIENGLLTSQYKPRRRAILSRYGVGGPEPTGGGP